MKTKNKRKSWSGRLGGLTLAVVLLTTLVPLLMVQSAEWITLIEGTEEGAPPVVEVV